MPSQPKVEAAQTERYREERNARAMLIIIMSIVESLMNTG